MKGPNSGRSKTAARLHGIRLLGVVFLLSAHASALAEPLPAVTPFEGVWVPKGEANTCEDAKHGAGGNSLMIEGRTIGSGDTVCTMLDMNVQKAAAQLAIHPNTMYARLERIREVTGLDAQRYHDLTELLLGSECRLR